MKIEILKWEIGLLFNAKIELQKMGRDLDYDENKRLSYLRSELDKYEYPIETTTKIEEEKKSLDIPF